MSLFLRLECQIIHFEFVYYSFFLSIHLELKQQTRSHTPVDFSKTIPDSRRNGQNVNPFSDQNSAKTIPFGVAHTYIAYIMVYLPASGYNNAFNLELVHLFQLSVMRNSTWLGSCLIMTFPMKATFHASLVQWNILLMGASYAGYISFCHQVSCCYCYYYYHHLIKHRVFPRKTKLNHVSVMMMMMIASLYHYIICMIASF